MEYGLGKFGNGTGSYVKNAVESETSIVNKILNTVQKRFPDAVLIKLHGGGYQRAGLSDLYIAVRGVDLWVEVKCPGSDTTALQKRFLERLHANGVFCGTAESPERVMYMIGECLGMHELAENLRT